MSSALLQSFQKSLAAFPMGSQERIVIAVSGGPDSVCLLHLFRQWIGEGSASGQPSQALNRLHVAHLNHSFRPEADEEAEFVTALCQSWGISSTVSKRPVAEICKEKKLSKLEGARLVRYAFLREVAHHQRARWIAVGHTADDGAETFLMNLIRGAGGEGLRGIPRTREETIIRPLLHITRDEIMRELQTEKIPYREDPSNQDKRFLRTRVRHDLMPLLSTINPNIKKTLLRAATLMEEENRFFNKQIEALAVQIFRTPPDAVICDLSCFCSLHKALQRRLIRWGIHHLQGSTEGIGFDHIEAILTDVVRGTQPISLPHNLVAEKRGNTLCLTFNTLSKASLPAAFEIPNAFLQYRSLETPLDIPSWKIRLRFGFQESRKGTTNETDAAFLDYGKIRLPWVIRSWSDGDTFTPFGMRGRHKKLQDFFVDRKIPHPLRRHIPLLVGPEGIVWVIGYTIDERYRITEATKTVLTLRMETSSRVEPPPHPP